MSSMRNFEGKEGPASLAPTGWTEEKSSTDGFWLAESAKEPGGFNIVERTVMARDHGAEKACSVMHNNRSRIWDVKCEAVCK